MYTHAWQKIMHFSCIIEENINFNPLTTVHEALSSKTLSRTKFVQQKRSSLIYFDLSPLCSDSIGPDINLTMKHRKSHMPLPRPSPQWCPSVSVACNRFLAEQWSPFDCSVVYRIDLNWLLLSMHGSIAFECEVPHWKGCERIIVWLLQVYLKYRLSPANWGRQRSSAGYQCNFSVRSFFGV